MSNGAQKKASSLELADGCGDPGAQLSPSLFHFGAALADLETRIALTDHVDSATPFDDLAIGVAVFQCANAADNFHRIDLAGRIG
jgi:hypothetical protein